MTRKILTPKGEGRPIGMYSAGFVAGPAPLAFIAGQVSVDADGQTVGAGDVAAQAAQVYRNLAAVLADAGCAFRDVVKLTTYLTRQDDWEPYRQWRSAEFPRLFPDGVYPPSTAVAVLQLARPEFLLEVEAIAVVPTPPTPRRRRTRKTEPETVTPPGEPTPTAVGQALGGPPGAAAAGPA